jgi:flavodoxin/NAD-dependent dihydropyrimidine dehydrogenase PreA subunit
MRCLICYYSGSGNTKLACDYIAGKMKQVEFVFYNILENKIIDFSSYDIIGFAAFTDYWGPSPKFKSFVRLLPKCSGKPAFVFNTYGMFSGGTMGIMYRLVARRGFRIIAGHGLHMPENIPTMILMGMANEQAPNDKEMIAFKKFIGCLSESLSSSESLAQTKRFRPPLPDRFLLAMPRILAKSQMGPKFVDTQLCTKCRKCINVCPYGAISMTAFPKFDEKKCCACWACYNHCPTLSIYTKKYRGKGHYPAPIAAVREKMKME